ncbi:MAG: ComEA family DNA-binding protein, partial [Candidatus Dadabacteria bacterium]
IIDLFQKAMKRLLFLSACFYMFLQAPAQEIPASTEEQLENIAESSEDELIEDDNYLQELGYFEKHPINLNEADDEDLQQLHFLSPLQVRNILSYRKLAGKFIDLHELQSIPAMDLFTIKKLLPYVYLGPSEKILENILKRLSSGEQYVMLRGSRIIERSKGYDTTLNTHYIGDPDHLLLRYRFQYKNLLEFGVLADKDAGEPFFKGENNKGFDFYSFHFFARKIGFIKAIALGDYVVDLGQGLTQWQSFGYGRTGDLSSIKRQSAVLMPYKSVGEYNFNRGAGITLQFDKIEATAFASYKKFSGNIVEDTTDRFSSILTSGYHRTPGELSDRNNIIDLSFGGNISYSTSALKLGFNSVVHRFSAALQKRDDPYNYFAPTGDRYFNSSVDYSYTYNNIHVFGEAATDKGANLAFVNGALLSVDPKVDLSFIYRRLPAKYQSLFGNAMTQNSLPSNENGLYYGIFLRLIPGLQFNGYADLFSFPFLKYRVNSPSKGSEYLLQLRYQPGKTTELSLRYKSHSKGLNENESSVTTRIIEQEHRENVRIHFFTQLLPGLKLKARVENSWYRLGNTKKSEGFLAYVEGSFKLSHFKTNLRLQYFSTGGYDSRIYAYESDVLYSYSIPAFFDKGFRYYNNVEVDLSQRLSFWLRWSQMLFINKEVVGSGLDEIRGNRRSELKMQLRYTF